EVLDRGERAGVVDDQLAHITARAWFGMSVMNMCPGLCVIMDDGLGAIATGCGVTPHAQNTGTSPGRTPTESPQSGRSTSATPREGGSPTCTRATTAFAQ